MMRVCCFGWGLFMFLMVHHNGFAQEFQEIYGKVIDTDGSPLSGATVWEHTNRKGAVSGADGTFRLRLNKSRESMVMRVSFLGCESIQDTVASTARNPLIFVLKRKEEALQEVVLLDRSKRKSSIYLNAVEGMAIYAGKKTALIQTSELMANVATNNARQVFAKIPGLNIWESDRAGLQLGIGGRGLSPNRTSNFNTRQNGYDISADALGYPESYYTPPTQAVERIELVRGAASLQYGTQFGGMINFKMKEGPTDRNISLHSEQTLGSWGFFSSFNSFGGNAGPVRYYSFYQRKQGYGARPNTYFKTDVAYLDIRYQLTDRLSLGGQYTYMGYLAQQAGGLTDRQFETDPYQSFRKRNWFSVYWNLFSLNLDYTFSDRSKLNSKTFGLLAYRKALGVLSSPLRSDDEPYGNRDLIYGKFLNIGNETRWSFKYALHERTDVRGVFLLGVRVYSGQTTKKQGVGNRKTGAQFEFLEGERLKSDFIFPSKNFSLFSEHVFFLSSQFSVTPGVRWEFIETAGRGVYDASTYHPSSGEVLLDRVADDAPYRARHVLLYGLGVSYKSVFGEVYGNFSKNYKAINFNDIRIVSPNSKVDEKIKDENGYSLDFGLRGQGSEYLRYDVSFFSLRYNDRIGVINKAVEDKWFGARAVRFRTNVADAYIFGVESFAELSLIPLIGMESKDVGANIFSNVALIKGAYLASDQNGVTGNDLELAPEVNLKFGVNMRYHGFRIGLQYSYVGSHYTEATNAKISSTGIDGLIPAYAVVDLSMSYRVAFFFVDLGVNNLTNQVYFTRRSSGYPGPGIIPSDPVNYYFSVGVEI